MKSVFIGGDKVSSVFVGDRRQTIADMTDLYPEIVSSETLERHLPELSEVEVIFSTWGMPAMTREQLELMPRLKAVFYAAGSVKGFADSFLDKGITVFSAWVANARPVAEFALAQILLSCKGYYLNERTCRTYAGRTGNPCTGPGIYGTKVALIGAGMIARTLISLLKPFALEVLVVDPYLADAEAAELGVRKVTLDEAFRQAYVVSNHLPNLPELRHELNEQHFSSLQEGATFINTGRGAQVDEEALGRVLEKRSDLTALLDVTLPEPPEKDSPFYELDNVVLTSHIAGSINSEVVRMADYMIEEFKLWKEGKELRYSVTKEMLKRMA